MININEYDYPDKVQALIDFLDLDIEDDNIDEQGDYYAVNERKVLSGTSPTEHKKQVKLLKSILPKNKVEQIKSIIILDHASSETRDKVYYAITKYVKRYKKNTPEYKELKHANLYCANLVCHLLSDEQDGHVLSVQEAFLGKPIKDRRTSYNQSDGEYLILEDYQADERAEEYLTDDPYLWKQAVESGNTTQGLDDWASDVLSYDGRGSLLSSYDGCENEQDDYFIYRTN